MPSANNIGLRQESVDDGDAPRAHSQSARQSDAPCEWEVWLAAQRQALESALNGESLDTSLGVLVQTALKSLGEGSRGGFYLASGDGTKLHHVVGMPEGYAEAVDGVKIGPESFACGLTIATGQPVLTEDVMTDPRWQEWREVAARFDFRGCWSFPIHSMRGGAVGTLALYWREPRAPNARELELAALITHTASIIISQRGEAAARKLAEQRLRESTDRIASLVELMPAAVYTCDREGRLTFYNRRAVELWGREPQLGDEQEKFCGSFRMWTPDGAPVMHDECPMADAVREGRSARNMDVVIEHPTGSRVVVSVNIDPLYDAEGRVVGAINVFEDITARRRDESLLRESGEQARKAETRLRSMFNTDTVGVIVFDDTGVVLEANDAFLRLTCYSRGDIESRELTWQGMTPPEYVDESERQLEKLVETGRIGPYEKQYYRKDGTRTWLLFAGATLGDGTFVEFVVDIEDRKRAEAALRESEGRLRIALQAARMGIWTWDIERDVHRRDANLNTLLGLPAVETQEALPKFLEHVHPDDREMVAREFERTVQRGHNLNVAFRTVWPDGTIRWLQDQGDIFGGGDGRYMAGACMDITERKQLEEALRDADRRKDEFLALLAHELRNPLAPIRNTLQLLKTIDGEKLHQAVDMMDEQVDHIVRLVDDLLDVSRISRGKMELRQEVLDVGEIARRAVQQLRPLYEQRELTISTPAGPVYANVDPARLLQIIGNLLHNAAKFTEAGGNVGLTIEQVGNEAVIRVDDDGIGLDESQSQRIFEMFAQVDSSLERRRSGLGLGLTLVSSVAELHGGTVTAESEGLGKGTEFVVRLPLAEAPAPRRAATPNSHAGGGYTGGKGRILVVDDSQLAANSLAMLLRLEGYEVETRYDGVAAVAAAEELHPDAIVLDIGMPGVNGYEACEAIRQFPSGSSIAIVALTGWGQESDIRRAKAAGFDAMSSSRLRPRI